MTTIELIAEAAAATGGSYVLGIEYLRAQLPRWGCAASAIAVMSRKRDRRPEATHFRVERGPSGAFGRVTLFAPTSRQYVFGEQLPAAVTVRYGRARSGARVPLFIVGGTEYRKFDRAFAAATGGRA